MPSKNTDSTHEIHTVKVLDLLASVREVADAVSSLTADDQRLPQLLYGKNYSLRIAGREIHASKNSVSRYEEKALRNFVSALGCVLVES